MVEYLNIQYGYIYMYLTRKKWSSPNTMCNKEKKYLQVFTYKYLFMNI